jgi:nucleotide sugar dehydrogenase
VNFWSVREAANSQPFSHLHVPGLGVGGACIPVYPWFVAESVTKSATRLIVDSREINDSMVGYLVDSLLNNFKANGETKIGILGLAFRGGVADSRMSVTYRLVDTLRENGFNRIWVHDPLIRSDRKLGDILTNDLEKILSEADIAVIATDHKMYSEYPWETIGRRKSKLKVIDTKGVLRDLAISNVEVYGLGYGEGHNPKILEAPN